MDKLNTHIDSMKCLNPYDGLITAKMSFLKPYPFCSDIEILSLAVMKLLLRYVYNQKIAKGKFTIGYTMSCPYSSKISFILGSSLDLRNSNGEMKPSVGLYTALVNLMLIQAEKYESSYIYDIHIRVYYDSHKNEVSHIDTSGPSLLEVDELLLTTFQSKDFISMEGTPPQVESFRKKREIQKYITKAEIRKGERKAFIVADLETIMHDNDEGVSIHVPYAAGFLVIEPDADVGSIPIHKFESYYSEDFYHDSFLQRSDYMMTRFIERISRVSFKRKIKSIYFHNMSKFDGVIIMKYYIRFFVNEYKIKALMRNNCLYQLSIFCKNHKSLTYKYMDSLKILPGKLVDLGKAICPELGSKGSVDHESVKEENLKYRRAELIAYMNQDIRLLGGCVSLKLTTGVSIILI